MEMFTEPVLVKATDPAMLAKRMPGFGESMEGAAAWRQLYREDGSDGYHHGMGWKHVASLMVPALAIGEVLDPELLKDKRRFYGWVDSHPEYLTYDRRAAMSRRPFFGWTPDASPDQG